MTDPELDAPTRVGPTPRPKKQFDSTYKSGASCPVFQGYEIVHELGRGGMGLVYLARQVTIDRLVALKSIDSPDPALADALAQEAKIAGKLEHPGIVPVFEANTSTVPWYFSMGYVEGTDLARFLARQVMSESDAIDLGLQVCDALAHAHQNEVLHLDVKPANILLDCNQQPRLTDFGLSAVHQFQETCAFGTPQYMAPEQALAKSDEISARTDIYSLGAVLYACVCGRPPFVSASTEDLVVRVVSERPASLMRLGTNVSSGYNAIVLKCLEKDPNSRYQSVDALRDDLRALQAGEPITAKPPSILSSTIYQIRKHLFAATVSGSTVILLLLLVGSLISNYVTQSYQMAELQMRHDILRKNLTANLTVQQRADLADAVAGEHFELGHLNLAAEVAASGVLWRDAQEQPPTAEQIEILTAYAESRGEELPADQVLNFAKATISEFAATLGLDPASENE